MTNLNLPPYPSRWGGKTQAEYLRQTREKSAAAAKELDNEIARLEDAAADSLADQDARQATRDRLKRLAEGQRTIDRKERR